MQNGNVLGTPLTQGCGYVNKEEGREDPQGETVNKISSRQNQRAAFFL